MTLETVKCFSRTTFCNKKCVSCNCKKSNIVINSLLQCFVEIMDLAVTLSETKFMDQRGIRNRHKSTGKCLSNVCI